MRIIPNFSLLTFCFLWLPCSAHAADPIDRAALVERHHPVVTTVDPLSPLSVGNGEFAFTADVTGLQSFPESYADGIPLSTQSQWGWHTFPNPAGYQLADTEAMFDSHGRQVPYASLAGSDAGQWLRANPHRLGLGRIGFEFTRADGSIARLEDVTDIHQTLELWTGTLISKYRVDGQPVSVVTCCHPRRDMIAVSVESPLIAAGRLKIVLRFAYGSGQFGKQPENWSHPEAHTTTVVSHTDRGAHLSRQLDDDSYHVRLAYSAGCMLTETDRHRFVLSPGGESDRLEVVVEFTPAAPDGDLPTVADVQSQCSSHWQEFWTTDGAIDLSGSTDPRAAELERRIVLSQYLTAIQCAGDLPPQETGLTFNSWYGKSHLEMHWWHGVHFALWNRLPLLEKGLSWYDEILPRARETARHQGYEGARWPKMVGPEGRESPSTVGVFLIWQQPHPIYYAELCYRSRPTIETLDNYADVVEATAEFMASYAHWDEQSQRYDLGPPLIPAQEHYDPLTTVNPTFELEYWHWALGVAQQWRKRRRLLRQKHWDHVRAHLAPLSVADDVYETAEGLWINTDHPSHLAAFGILPGERVDRPTMRRTLTRVLSDWNWQRTWGWDYPMVAMTAARLGDGEAAVDALLMDVPKNRYLPNGHNHQDDRLPIYLPGNGGLLTAVAMMAAGWDGAPRRHAPGFPDNGQWQVRWENLQPLP